MKPSREKNSATTCYRKRKKKGGVIVWGTAPPEGMVANGQGVMELLSKSTIYISRGSCMLSKVEEGGGNETYPIIKESKKNGTEG